MRSLSAAVLTVLLTGCMAAVPFKDAAPVGRGERTPQQVVQSFKEQLPGQFHLLSSIVFDYGFVAVSGIGYLDIDRAAGRYKVACLNHLGVKFFEFEGDRNGLSRSYVIEPLARQGDIAGVVGEDIKRIYLDVVPGSGAGITAGKDSILFRQRSGDGALEFVFGGEGFKLLTKTYREDHRAVWRIAYYDYQIRENMLYPTAIVLTNYKYGYRLIVRQKEIRG